MVNGRALGRVGMGVAAAGAAAAAGVLAERRSRGGGLATWVQDDGYEHVPDRTASVTADDGVRLHVEIDEPDGSTAPGRPTVVLSHGYCLSLRSWVLQQRALVAAGYRVVSWDQRSHGMSGRAPAQSCTIDQLGRDLRAVLDAEAPTGPLILVGHSMGGMTTMALGADDPALVAERVLAVAFVATSAGGSPMVTLGFGPMLGSLIGRVGPGVLHRLGHVQDGLLSLRRLGRGLEDGLVARFSFDSPMSKEAVRFAGDLIFATPFAVMADFLPTLEDLDLREALAAFTGVEVLVVNGMGDLLTPPEHSADIVRLVPGAEHVVVEDAGHLIMLEHPDLVSDQLLALADRGMRDVREDVVVERKPRVRRTVTDIARMHRPGRAGARARRAARKGA